MANIADTLEQRVRAASAKVSFVRKVMGTVAPVFAKYDLAGEAERLMKDGEIQQLMQSEYAQENELSYDQVMRYLWQSKERYNGLWNSAKVADSADRLTSIAGGLIETGAGAAGAALSVPTGGLSSIAPFLANGGEELLEMAFKVPFFLYAFRDKAASGYANTAKRHIKRLLAIEAATFAIPVAGDAIDALTNLYVDAALDVIREDAKARLLQDYKPAQIVIG